MSEHKATGVIRVERRGDKVSLNVFGTYALLGKGDADDLIDAIDDILEDIDRE